MVLFNYATKELTAKVVYYGPGLCGKTTNLQFIYDTLPNQAKGKMLSLATKTDRTLFFDFLPIDLGTIRGMKTKIQLYTVPGQVFYDTTRKLVLKGADGVVFVADSQQPMLDANIDSFENLITNLKEQNLDIESMPHVIQFNKRDMKNVLSVKELETQLNRFKVPTFEAVAPQGAGVFETLKGVSKLVLKNLGQKYGLQEELPADDTGNNLGKPPLPRPKLPNLPPRPQAASEHPTVPQDSKPASTSGNSNGAKPKPPNPEKPAPKVERPATVSKDFNPPPDSPMDEIEFIEDDSIMVDPSLSGSVEEMVDFVDEPTPQAPNKNPKVPKLRPLPSLDDSEVIELEDGDPLDVEELDDMAEIANMASESSKKNTAPEVEQLATSQSPEPIEVPVSINLPSALGGKPLSLRINITFED